MRRHVGGNDDRERRLKLPRIRIVTTACIIVLYKYDSMIEIIIAY